MVLSLTTVSKDSAEAIMLIHKIRDWFSVFGYSYLKAENIVVVHTTAITSRNSLVVDDYEMKYGLDVTIRVLDEVVLTSESIESVNLGS